MRTLQEKRSCECPAAGSTTEQGEYPLGLLVRDGERLRFKLGLDLSGLEFRGVAGEIGVNEISDAAFQGVS